MLKSGAIDFDRLGGFVASLGADAHRDEGLHGVFIGKLNTLACVLTADQLNKIIGRGGPGLVHELGVEREL